MANAASGSKLYVDSVGLLTDQTRSLVTYILFTPSAANDQIVLAESATGANCIVLQSATAKTTLRLDFAIKPVVFNNGIYVKTLSTGATATIITTQGGS